MIAASFRTQIGHIWRYRNILFAVVLADLSKRYAGSLVGLGWVVLQPLMFLLLYLFLYMVVFQVRFPGYSELDYVAYVFAGLVPFLGVMDAVNSGVPCVKQNIHLIKNVVMPINLIPVRTVMVALVPQMVGLGLVAALLLFSGRLSPAVVFLPVVLIFQVLMLCGLVWFLAAFGVVLPDLGQVINLLMLFMMFVSPVAFRPDMVPPQLAAVLWLNPFHYMLAAFRGTLLAGNGMPWRDFAVFAAFSVGAAMGGAWVFDRLKGVIVDYE